MTLSAIQGSCKVGQMGPWPPHSYSRPFFLSFALYNKFLLMHIINEGQVLCMSRRRFYECMISLAYFLNPAVSTLFFA